MARVQNGPAPEEAPSLDRVLDTAAQLFRTRGYAATTTREIAARLGIQKASLYYHISSKEDLLYKIVVSSQKASLEAIEAAAAQPGDPIERLRRTVRAHLVQAHGDPDKNGTALIEMRALEGERRQEIIGLRNRYEDVFRNLVEDAQRAGALRDDLDSHYLVLALLSMLNWSLVWYHPGGRLGIEELADVLLTVFLDGTLAERGSWPPIPKAAAPRKPATRGSASRR